MWVIAGSRTMTSKIFKSIILVAVTVLLACFVIITGIMYQYFTTVQANQLKDELRFAANGVQQLGESYLEEIASDRYRLTWVAADGSVIYDSHADAASMGNHTEREEIREALAGGTGSSTRKSQTLLERTVYEALRLEDGSVLRISVSRASVFVLVLGMLQPLAFVAILAVIISAWLAQRMAKRVVAPLNSLNLDNPMENEAYEELSPLLRRINAQQMEIKSQIRILKQKQDEFEQITANMKEALVLLDSGGRILSINPAAKLLFDSEDGCVGEDFLSIERGQKMRNALDTAAAQGYATFRDENKGKVYQFDLSRIDVDNKYHGMVILAFDITEQLNAEKHRQEFTANVSHELKTPLQTIIGSAELMENGLVKEEDIPCFAGRLRKEAARLVALIDDILRLSQLDEGLEMPRETVRLKDLAEEVLKNLSDVAERKNVSLELCGDDGSLMGVRRLLYELVYNLCDNAIKYNIPGGSVKVCIENNGKELALSVQDTGIGIPAEHQEKVFERFYRVDKSHSKQTGGTGLGLSIVKHAAYYHGGKTELKSEENKGTTVRVVFKTSEM